jgi:hypothetical protein
MPNLKGEDMLPQWNSNLATRGEISHNSSLLLKVKKKDRPQAQTPRTSEQTLPNNITENVTQKPRGLANFGISSRNTEHSAVIEKPTAS